MREYPDDTLAVFHGPRLLARFEPPASLTINCSQGRSVNRFDAATCALRTVDSRYAPAHKLHKAKHKPTEADK